MCILKTYITYVLIPVPLLLSFRRAVNLIFFNAFFSSRKNSRYKLKLLDIYSYMVCFKAI